MSPEERAEILLAGDGWPDRTPDLADAIDAFAREMDLDRAEVAAQIADRLLKAVRVERLRRLTKVYVEG